MNQLSQDADGANKTKQQQHAGSFSEPKKETHEQPPPPQREDPFTNKDSVRDLASNLS